MTLLSVVLEASMCTSTVILFSLTFFCSPKAMYDPYGFRYEGGDGSKDEKPKRTIDQQVDVSLPLSHSSPTACS